jgi:aryl-alcohol dehydrogenase-like predicted oxidoreductase
MNYSYLGRTGLKVSRIGLGIMNFGMETSEAESLAVLDAAADAGINFVDTADVYGGPQSPDIKQGYGISEEYIGRWLAQDAGRRDKIVLATKLYQPMGTGPNDRGLSAYHIRKACEDSLRRLRTDHIDLYQIHHVDRSTPWEEIWQAMEQLVTAGKVIYLGSSNFAGWQIATAQGVAASRHFMGLVSEQSLYNLSARTIEWRSSLRCGTSVWDSFRTVRWAAACSGVRCRRPARAVVPMTECGSGSSGSDRSWRPTTSCVASSVSRRPTSRWLGCCINRRSRQPSSAHVPQTS